MPKNYRFYFRLASEDKEHQISPDNLRGKDLAFLISTLDSAVSSILLQQFNDDFGGLHITQIRKGSVFLTCAGNNAQHKAFQAIIAGMGTGKLPQPTKKCLLQLREFNSSLNTRIEMRNKKNGEVLAVIKQAEHTFSEKAQIVKTCTVFYGKIVGLTGTSKIRAQLSLSGYVGTVDFPVSRQDAKQIGARYNDTIAIRGEAEIKLPERQILNFQLHEIIYDYLDTKFDEAINNIKEQFGIYFDEMPDIDEFIAGQRG